MTNGDRNMLSYWVSLRFIQGKPKLMVSQRLYLKGSKLRASMRQYGYRMLVNKDDLMIFMGTQSNDPLVWVKQKISVNDFIADCQEAIISLTKERPRKR